jgi:hypothetical protein
MKKETVAFCLILIALSSAMAIKPSQAAQATATVSVHPAKINLTTAYVGQTIQIDINISNVQGLWGWALQNVNFNPKVLNVTNVQEGPFLKSKDSTFFLWTSNSTIAFSEGDIPEINCAFAEDNTVSGGGVLATITFRVLSAGSSPITIGAAALMSDIPSISMDENNEISCTWTNGTVTVATISSSTAPPDVISPTPSPNSGATGPQTSAFNSSPPASTPDAGNALSASNNPSNMYLYIVIIAVVAGAILAGIFVRRRK